MIILLVHYSTGSRYIILCYILLTVILYCYIMLYYIDGFSDSQDIVNQFASKYSDLHNSSESDKRSIDAMWVL